MREIFIGCDIAKSKIDFCILNSTRNNSYYGQFENNEDGFEQFLKTVAVLHPLCEPFVTMESTSSYTFAFQKYL
ncbi:IS110 family transposase, partial [Sulfurimonas sp.]|uniref:IS110 family transposase n=1 Tax=Sulfurimonas sp. TaxID=2022749 RepID=UPI003D151299